MIKQKYSSLRERPYYIVLDVVNFVTSEPVAPNKGNTYLNTTAGVSSITGQTLTAFNVVTWNGTNWSVESLMGGEFVYSEAGEIRYTFNGVALVNFTDAFFTARYFFTDQASFQANTTNVYVKGDFIYIRNPRKLLRVTTGGTGFAGVVTGDFYDAQSNRELPSGTQFAADFTPDSALYGNFYYGAFTPGSGLTNINIADLQNNGTLTFPAIGEKLSFVLWNGKATSGTFTFGTSYFEPDGTTATGVITLAAGETKFVDFEGYYGIPSTWRRVVIAAESKTIISQWQPSTFYATGEVVWDATNAVYIKRVVAGTSGLTLNNAEKIQWEIVSSYGVGLWTSSTYFHPGQDVIYSNKILKQVAGQVSNATFNTLESGKWQLIESKTINWAASTFYYANEQVKQGNRILSRISNGVSNATFDNTEASLWGLVSNESINTWTASTYYYAGELLNSYGSRIIARSVNGISGATFDLLEAGAYSVVEPCRRLNFSAATVYYANEEITDAINGTATYSKISSGFSGASLNADLTAGGVWTLIGGATSNSIANAPYTVKETDDMIDLPAGSAFTITIPAGRVNKIIKFSTNQLSSTPPTIQTSGAETIVNPSSFTAGINFVMPGTTGLASSVTFQLVGTQWRFIA